MENDKINPSHYKQYPVEVIDMMEAIWGAEAVKTYCLMTAFKYRMRLGHKDDITQELEKERWYLDRAKRIDKMEPKKSAPVKLFYCSHPRANSKCGYLTTDEECCNVNKCDYKCEADDK